MGFLLGEEKQAKEIECKVCRKLNAAKFSFCTKCGAKLNKPPSLGQFIKSILLAPLHLLFGKYKPPPPYKHCDDCADKLFVPEARFCGYCGKKLVPLQDKPIDLPQAIKMFIGGALGLGAGYLAAPGLLLAPSPEAERCVSEILGFVGILMGAVIAQDLGICGRIAKRILLALAAAVAIGFVNFLNTAK